MMNYLSYDEMQRVLDDLLLRYLSEREEFVLRELKEIITPSEWNLEMFFIKEDVE